MELLQWIFPSPLHAKPIPINIKEIENSLSSWEVIHSIDPYQRFEILMGNQPSGDIPSRCLHILITEEFNTTALLLRMSFLCLVPYIIRHIFCINLYLGELWHISLQLAEITCLFKLTSGEAPTARE